MSIYNWGFNNFYINSFMPTPYWGGCGCNAFNSGFSFGILNSLFNYSIPQMNTFSFMPQFSMPLFTPYNNIFAMANNYTMPSFTPALFNYNIPSLFSQLNTFNNYTNELNNIINNNNFDFLLKQKKSNNNRTTIPMEIDRSFQNSEKLDSNFLNRVKEIAQKLNCDYKDLLALMNSESGIKTDNWNGSTAVGLIQFTDASVAELNNKYGLNFTKEKIARMSPMEQLDLVEKYLTIAKSYNFAPNERLSAGDLYAITFLPGRAGQDILCRRGEKFYSQNKGLDLNNDGVISKQDLENKLAKKHINESIFA